MAQSFSEAEWRAIHEHLDGHERELGLPQRREHSIVLGSFNVRKFGGRAKRSEGAWKMLRRICARFDLLAIQEVQDDLEGLRHLKDSLNEAGGHFGLVASDITGSYPGDRPAPERLAFLFRWDRVERTEIASDITYDRSRLVDTLYGSRLDFWKAFDSFTQKHVEWEVDTEQRREEGRKPKRRPVIRLPRFLSFIRQPLCVSFRVPGIGAARPYEFLAVNAHLLYGRYKKERWLEFQALISWLIDRACRAEHMYHPNILLLGDLNLDFKQADKRRAEIEELLKSINRKHLAEVPTKVNFPFLDVHPARQEVFRTNARLSETYDHAAFVCSDGSLPLDDLNDHAGRHGPDGYDFGIFNFVELFREVLGLPPFAEMSTQQKTAFCARFEHDLSDHMPLWVRVPLPGTAGAPKH